ncbi:MAG: AAA family ATPase, partial [Deltaproteobacteria bacterium]|nr:AAA family ATPase [Deltaproteobacteria bacterium]
MYLSHYNLVEKPFQITTDPKFLWLGEKYQEALAMLKYGVLDNRGFLLLTGDVGTGKTTLINALHGALGSNVIVANVVDPNLEILEFFILLATAFDIEAKFTKKVDFLTNFTQFLNNAHTRDKQVLLIIDEAQKLSKELLEEIRVLSNIEKENRKLLNIFFVGQNEFNKTLLEKECRALRQRITITHQIRPLTESETREYIKYRLNVAGTDQEIFTGKAIRKIHVFSSGYPRLINIICDQALLTGYVRGLQTINPAIVKECAQELSIPGETGPNRLQGQPSTAKQGNKTLRRAALYACLLPVIAFSGYLFIAVGYNDYIQNIANYYGHKIAPRFYTTRLPRSKEAHEGAVLPVAGDLKSQESVDDSDRPEVYRASVAVLEAGRGDAVASEENMTDAAGRDSSTPTPVSSTGQALPSSVKGEDLSEGDLKLIIPFHYDKCELSEKALDTIDRLAAVMIKNPEMEIVVKGYTDTIGPPPYNKNLSELRAKTVKKYLVARGISPLRIQAVGMGEENPLKPNTT